MQCMDPAQQQERKRLHLQLAENMRRIRLQLPKRIQDATYYQDGINPPQSILTTSSNSSTDAHRFVMNIDTGIVANGIDNDGAAHVLRGLALRRTSGSFEEIHGGSSDSNGRSSSITGRITKRKK